MTTANQEEIADYTAQAWSFLAKARDYLEAGDLHQASEKGWGAASHMVNAVAAAHGWDYNFHAEFNPVMGRAAQFAEVPRIRALARVANELHSNFYTRQRFLDAGAISDDLNDIAELLQLLGPLVLPDREGQA